MMHPMESKPPDNEELLKGIVSVIKGILIPIPWFIIYPGRIHNSNVRLLASLIEHTSKEPSFVNNPKNKEVLFRICVFILFWRGWMMRIQWCIQIIAIIALSLLIRRIFHV